MRPEDLLKLFEEDAKILGEEEAAVLKIAMTQDMEPLAVARPIAKRKKRKRKLRPSPPLKVWESIEGPLTPGSFPLADTQSTKSFRDGLSQKFAHATEPCPDIKTMVGYVNHELDSATAEHMAAHILHCEDSAEEFIGLSRVSNQP